MRADRYKIAVIGGDKRQVYLAHILAKEGYAVSVYGLCEKVNAKRIQEAESLKEALEQAKVVICPVPFIRSGKVTGMNVSVKTLLESMPENALLFAGNIPDEVGRYSEGKGIREYDMMKDELVAARNAIATAEGTVAEAIARSPVNLTGSRCLVLGYGRCGTVLTRLLKSFLCKVIVCEKDRTRRANVFVLADDVVSEEELASALEKVDFVFNTVPEKILTEEMLRYAGKDTWIFDIASAPGGVDYSAAEALAVNAVPLPGLPGRYAPASSARILADFIESHIELHKICPR